MRASTVRIASVYPELLGTYGDTGNVRVLERRLRWRNIPVEIVSVPLSAKVPRSCDLYILGGGEDDAQSVAAKALRSSDLPDAANSGAVVFAVCAGLQILGHTFGTANGSVEPGLGLLDVTTTRLQKRAVGEVITAPNLPLGLPPITGFENHGGATRLGVHAKPLAAVVTGTGNDEDSGQEGVVQGSLVATYLHGPVLARNPALADLLLRMALRTELPPLDDGVIEALRSVRLGLRQGF